MPRRSRSSSTVGRDERVDEGCSCQRLGDDSPVSHRARTALREEPQQWPDLLADAERHTREEQLHVRHYLKAAVPTRRYVNRLITRA
jgi:hypothetical protein